MKRQWKRAFAFGVIMIFSSISYLYAGDRSSGCGLGWSVTKSMTTSGSSTRNLTNATSSNTLAMTSGTSGCEKHSLVLQDKMKIHFIESNIRPLEFELAIGSGERLNTIGRIMGCSDERIPHFSSILKKNHNYIFAGPHDPSQVLSRIQDSLRGHCAFES